MDRRRNWRGSDLGVVEGDCNCNPGRNLGICWVRRCVTSLTRNGRFARKHLEIAYISTRKGRKTCLGTLKMREEGTRFFPRGGFLPRRPDRELSSRLLPNPTDVERQGSHPSSLFDRPALFISVYNITSHHSRLNPCKLSGLGLWGRHSTDRISPCRL
ncbi:hypothetical protein G7K_3722-t1 [Saitoella complicata NRRL Y-17804]|uniref:Uncharacterized protein n=1 Tax=Saitoella complicata (strain BCRC 22490 / CBS 7301 / JCM 7358 / NBRC 10748 / NRRL Y-17804) TaxID=698492 RepID=A0A0E9NID4_SAICN|nr:hypothetical protein G7K_3722-t1 [Saitoella complicata NRRL Y-17804]